MKSVLLYGPLGAGKTTFALNFVKKKNFPYTKIISPSSLMGKTESAKIEQISEVF